MYRLTRSALTFALAALAGAQAAAAAPQINALQSNLGLRFTITFEEQNEADVGSTQRTLRVGARDLVALIELHEKLQPDVTRRLIAERLVLSDPDHPTRVRFSAARSF